MSFISIGKSKYGRNLLHCLELKSQFERLKLMCKELKTDIDRIAVISIINNH